MNALSPALAVAASPAPLWSAPEAGPDAALLSLRTEFLAACADAHAAELMPNVPDEVLTPAVRRLNAACDDVAGSAPAQTDAGRALKAAAVMQQFRFCFDHSGDGWNGSPEAMAWDFLSELAREEYVVVGHAKFEPPRRVLPSIGAWPTVAPHPDAHLITLCERWIAIELRRQAIYDGPHAIADDFEAAFAAEPLDAQLDQLVAAMEFPRARTADGVAARARVVALKNGDFALSFDSRQHQPARLLGFLMRDAVGLAGGEGCHPAPATPDAELLAVCDEFCELQRVYQGVHAIHGETPAADAEYTRIYAAEDRLTARMGELSCSTVAGAQAMARALAAWDGELLRDTPAENTGELITAHLVGGLLGLPDAMASLPLVSGPASDAEQVAGRACA